MDVGPRGWFVLPWCVCRRIPPRNPVHCPPPIPQHERHAIRSLSATFDQALQVSIYISFSPLVCKEAANVLGVSVSNFIIGSVQARADEVIRSRYVIDLTMQRSRAFVEALHSPPGPNEALQRAKALYDESVEP